MINFRDWYTDLMDVYRTVPHKDGALTRHTREQVLTGIPCRLYHMDAAALRLDREAAAAVGTDWVQCDNEVEIHPGDELHIHRGAALGHSVHTVRAFSGEPQHYFEPFGAVMPGIAHQEIRLREEERAK